MTVQTDGLMRRAPSELKTDPDILASVLDSIDQEGLELHSLLVWQRDALILDAWWAPYAPHRPHMMHSVTKSFTSVAVGLAIDDGLLSVDDEVIRFFPEHLPPALPAEDLARLRRMRVRDLLIMASGHGRGISGGAWRRIASSWIGDFLSQPVPYEPGAVFVYDSGASYMLSAIVQKVTGERVHELLQRQLFRPLQMSDGMSWDVGPDGVNTGGNGLSCTTADMLKLGILHLRGGMWHDRRLLSRQWTQAATMPQLRDVVMGSFTGDHYLGPEAAAARPDIREGYGYQWWCGPHGSFSANGLFGQYCIVLPQQDAVVAFTGGLHDDDRRMHALVYDRLRPAFGAGGGSADADAALARRVAGLHLSTRPRGRPPGGAGRQRLGRYRPTSNDQCIEQVVLRAVDGGIALHLRIDGRDHSICAGYDRFIESTSTMPGAKLHHSYEPADGLKVAACACWRENETVLVFDWIFIETAFRDTVEIRFDDDALTLRRKVNVNSSLLELPPVKAIRLAQASSAEAAGLATTEDHL